MKGMAVEVLRNLGRGKEGLRRAMDAGGSGRLVAVVLSSTGELHGAKQGWLMTCASSGAGTDDGSQGLATPPSSPGAEVRLFRCPHSSADSSPFQPRTKTRSCLSTHSLQR